MENRLFNKFDLTNKEIEKILMLFNDEIKTAVRKINGKPNQDYEQIVRFQIFKTLSRNRKK